VPHASADNYMHLDEGSIPEIRISPRGSTVDIRMEVPKCRAIVTITNGIDRNSALFCNCIVAH
jgi:hypothetical protein